MTTKQPDRILVSIDLLEHARDYGQWLTDFCNKALEVPDTRNAGSDGTGMVGVQSIPALSDQERPRTVTTIVIGDLRRLASNLGNLADNLDPDTQIYVKNALLQAAGTITFLVDALSFKDIGAARLDRCPACGERLVTLGYCVQCAAGYTKSPVADIAPSDAEGSGGGVRPPVPEGSASLEHPVSP